MPGRADAIPPIALLSLLSLLLNSQHARPSSPTFYRPQASVLAQPSALGLRIRLTHLLLPPTPPHLPPLPDPLPPRPLGDTNPSRSRLAWRHRGRRTCGGREREGARGEEWVGGWAMSVMRSRASGERESRSARTRSNGATEDARRAGPARQENLATLPVHDSAAAGANANRGISAGPGSCTE